MMILLVEDNPQMRRYLKHLLEQLGASVRESADGEAALVAYAAQRPDWVVMDYEMPRLDGVSATRTLCVTDPQARIVMVTAFASPELRAAALAAGACAFVAKDELHRLAEIIAPSDHTSSEI